MEEEKENVEVFEIDDDFDPLEDAGFELDEEADEYAGGIEYQVPVIPDADRSVVPDPVVLPPEERIDNLIKGLPGQKFRLLEGIRVCDEPKTLEEASEALEAAYPQGASVYTAARIIELLTDAGALDKIDPEPEEGAEDEVEGVEQGATQGQTEEPAPATSAATVAAASPAVAEAPEEGAQALGADAEQDADERVESISLDDVEATADFEEVEQVAPSLYVATEAGKQAIEDRWSVSVAAKVVTDEPRYLPIWKQILELCSKEGGVTKKFIEKQVDDDPLLKEPRRWCQYFLGKYKDVAALRWGKTWEITDIGRELLDSDLFEGVESREIKADEVADEETQPARRKAVWA